MFELIYGVYNDVEERDIYEDIDDARTDFIHLSHYCDYDFIVLKDVNDDRIICEQFK